MKDKTFYALVIIVLIVGMILTFSLGFYTIKLSEKASITSYISNER